jgi:integrase
LPDDFYAVFVPEIKKVKPKLNLNSRLSFFREILYSSYRRGFIPLPPSGIRKPSQSKDIGRELSDDEICRLLKYAHTPELKLAIEMALLTGMRKMEILRLRWDYIDLEYGIVSLPKTFTKSRKARVFPIALVLKEKLTNRKKVIESPYVFPMRSNPNKPMADMNSPWNRVRKAARVQCRFHDLRHTAATRKLRAGNSQAVVGKEIGMSQSVLTEIYNHVSTEDMRQSAESVHLPVMGGGNTLNT